MSRFLLGLQALLGSLFALGFVGLHLGMNVGNIPHGVPDQIVTWIQEMPLLADAWIAGIGLLAAVAGALLLPSPGRKKT